MEDSSLVERDGTPVRTVRVQGGPVNLKPGNGSVSLFEQDGTLAKLDPTTGKTLAVERVGNNAVALAVGEGWCGWQSEAAASSSARGYPVVCGRPPVSPSPFRCHVGDPRHLASSELGQLPQLDSGSSWLRTMAAVRGTPAISGSAVLTVERPSARERHTDRHLRCPRCRQRHRLDRALGHPGDSLDRMVIAADAVQGGPICGVGTGTWIATAGPFKGDRGTFTLPDQAARGSSSVRGIFAGVDEAPRVAGNPLRRSEAAGPKTFSHQ